MLKKIRSKINQRVTLKIVDSKTNNKRAVNKYQKCEIFAKEKEL